MLPMESGCVVICSYVQEISHIKNNKTYVIVGNKEGLVYKRVLRNDERRSLILMSDNAMYMPYEIAFDEIAEIWEYYAHLSFSDEKKSIEHKVEDRIVNIEKHIEEIKGHIRGAS